MLKHIILLASLSSLLTPVIADDTNNWSTYLGDKSSSQYSTLSQVTPDNVSELTVAWTYSSNDKSPNGRSQIQCNPLVIDGILYGTTAQLNLVALDATNGKELWKFDPFAGSGNGEALGVNRGIAHWTDGKSSRILFGVNDSLYAIDTHNGTPIKTFGSDGKISLKTGLGRDTSKVNYWANTPGIIYKNLIIIGGRLDEHMPAAPGHIRAYNVLTGELVWIFHTIPQPGEPGNETWPTDDYKTRGGVNVWTGMALDEEHGIVYCPTGSASADFYGGDRKGQNLYANSLLALDANTGEHIWHFQLIHHDMWDRDIPSPPNLLTIEKDGISIPAVAQTTKSGHVFIFNRLTGEPVYPIKETPVPASKLDGEQAWPTQPLPTMPAPFARQQFTPEIATNLSPEANKAVIERLANLPTHVPFLPPSEEGSIIFPGFDGGAEWGGAATDTDGIMYVNANDIPWVLTMLNLDKTSSNGERLYLQLCASCHNADRTGGDYQGTNIPPIQYKELNSNGNYPQKILGSIKNGAGIMPPFKFLPEQDLNNIMTFLYSRSPTEEKSQAVSKTSTTPEFSHTGYHKFKDLEGYPAVKPPWGTLNAIDLNTGEFVWRTPLGEFEELTKRGIPKTGTENYGGPVTTAGGVLFIAATQDAYIRAFDMKTGKELWKHKLPTAGYATPSVYSINGQQHIVIACGGGKMGSPSGDSYVAFKLPE